MFSPVRVAVYGGDYVYGGGFANAILLHSLLKYPHLDVHSFEAETSRIPKEAAIGLSENGLGALDLLGSEAAQRFQQAGAVRMEGVRFQLARGDEGEFIAEIDRKKDHDDRILHLAPLGVFIQSLLADVSPDRLHSSKTLERIERSQGEDDGPVTLHFADGTTHECDVLIGVDGLHSTVRRFILGDDDAAIHPRNSGDWAIMATKPAAAVREIFGDRLVEEPRECPWFGDGAFFEHNFWSFDSKQEIVHFVLASHDRDAVGSAKKDRVVSPEELRVLYEKWPLHLNRAVHKLFCDEPGQKAIYFWEHPPACTYVSGSVCMAGDAAHATTPWHGAAAGLMVEDAMILSALLGCAKSLDETMTALKVYDQVRRPRTQMVVESSRRNGMIATGRDAEMGLDLDQLRTKLLPRWYPIVYFDTKQHLDDALQKFAEEVGKGTRSFC